MMKINKKNEGKLIKIQGREVVMGKVLASGDKFRPSHGEGETVPDYKLEDIEEAKGILIDIKK